MSDKSYLERRRDLKNGVKTNTDRGPGGKPVKAEENPSAEAAPPEKAANPPKSPGKKSAPKKAQKKIRTASKKRQKQNRQYTPVKRKYLADHPFCQVEGCGVPSTDLHHKRGRSGKQLLNLDDFMSVCRAHHDAFEREDKAAREAGHKQTRLGKPQK
jgi:hypothetical protein